MSAFQTVVDGKIYEWDVLALSVVGANGIVGRAEGFASRFFERNVECGYDALPFGSRLTWGKGRQFVGVYREGRDWTRRLKAAAIHERLLHVNKKISSVENQSPDFLLQRILGPCTGL